MKYSRATTEALVTIEQNWKGLDDSDRTVIGDAIETALKSAILDANTEAAQDMQTIIAILTKHAAK